MWSYLCLILSVNMRLAEINGDGFVPNFHSPYMGKRTRNRFSSFPPIKYNTYVYIEVKCKIDFDFTSNRCKITKQHLTLELQNKSNVI
jgi:hypothetical protein